MSIRAFPGTLVIKSAKSLRMPYSKQELEALLQHDEFIRWVTAPQPGDDARWHQWMQEHPDRPALVEKAQEIIVMIRETEAEQAGSPELAAQIWERITVGMETPVKKLSWKKYLTAAAVILLLGAGAMWYALSRTATAPLSYFVMEKHEKGETIARNTGKGLQVIYLTDGTRITLSPLSTVRYNRLPPTNKREVLLEGEAFFDVARDPDRPFYVYSGGIVTKVLGTSFRVKSDPDANRIVVAVKSGKVAVSRKERPETEAYILLPNEQVVFNRSNNTLEKTNVTNMALLSNPLPLQGVLNFDEAAAGDVIDTLARMYAADIQYDHAVFSKCRVTVSLDQESLYDKLAVLCKVLGATYEVTEDTIHITGQGCN